MSEKKFYDVPKLVEYIHLSKSSIYKLVSQNAIPHIKVGTRTLFEQEQINQWVVNGGRMNNDLPTLPKL